MLCKKTVLRVKEFVNQAEFTIFTDYTDKTVEKQICMYECMLAIAAQTGELNRLNFFSELIIFFSKFEIYFFQRVFKIPRATPGTSACILFYNKRTYQNICLLVIVCEV